MKTTRRIAGRKAQHSGAAFEAMFLNACTFQGIVCTRIPDGCKQLPNNKLIRQKTPFDWVISIDSDTALIDTKSIDNHRFPHSLIDPAQALKLVRHDHKGTPSGYCVWLKKADALIYIPARLLCLAMQRPGSIGTDTPGITLLGSPTAPNLRQIFNANAPEPATISP